MKNRLKQLRLEKKRSQKATAELLGYHTTTYQRWEDDIHSIKLNDFINIAQFYNVSLDYLAGLTNDKSKKW